MAKVLLLFPNIAWYRKYWSLFLHLYIYFEYESWCDVSLQLSLNVRCRIEALHESE